MGKRNKIDLDQKILNLLPKDGKEVRARDIYEQGKREKLAKITIERKLKEWSDDGLLNRRDAGHMQVYYKRLENVRIQRLIKEFTEEVNASFFNLPEDMSLKLEGFADLVTEDLKKEGLQLSDEGRKALKEDKTVIEELGFQSFLEAVFKVFKVALHTKIARTEDFFIDKTGFIVPSVVVLERMKPSEMQTWNEISSSDK